MNERRTLRQLLREGGFFEPHLRDFIVRSLAPGRRVLVVGDDRVADVLLRVRPSYGLGLVAPGNRVPPSPAPHIEIRSSTIADLQADQPFDYIVFYESFGYEDKLYLTIQQLKSLAGRDTKVFIMTLNPLSIRLFKILRACGVRVPNLARNLLHLQDVVNLVELCRGEVIDKGYRFVCPFRLLGAGELVNRVVARWPGLRRLCIGQYVVVRVAQPDERPPRLSCSVVVPCHNEQANVAECVERIPDFGLWREIIVVDDGSTDDTRRIVESIAASRDDVRLITYPTNRGKGFAVREGWTAARGDVLMMLDCDMTSPPEELPMFHQAIEEGAEFINGTRIIYPREKQALAPLNRLGVTLFAGLMSWVLQQHISDTFCGTKVFRRVYWPHFEITEFLWGDWDLFFMAKRYRLKMAEFPVHYAARRAGESKMRPFRHGWSLLWNAFRGLKAIP